MRIPCFLFLVALPLGTTVAAPSLPVSRGIVDKVDAGAGNIAVRTDGRTTVYRILEGEQLGTPLSQIRHGDDVRLTWVPEPTRRANRLRPDDLGENEHATNSRYESCGPTRIDPDRNGGVTGCGSFEWTSTAHGLLTVQGAKGLVTHALHDKTCYHVLPGQLNSGDGVCVTSLASGENTGRIAVGLDRLARPAPPAPPAPKPTPKPAPLPEYLPSTASPLGALLALGCALLSVALGLRYLRRRLSGETDTPC